MPVESRKPPTNSVITMAIAVTLWLKNRQPAGKFQVFSIVLFRVAKFMGEFGEKPQSQHLVMGNSKTSIFSHFGDRFNNERGGKSPEYTR